MVVRSHESEYVRWKAVTAVTLEMHRAQSREDLIRLVIEKVPNILGIHYCVWHNRIQGEGLNEEGIVAITDYKNGVATYLDAINSTLMDSHPIVLGLGMVGGIELPKEAVTMRDFSSQRQLRETAIYQEAYKHIEIEDHAVVEFFDQSGKGAMICFNSYRGISDDQKLMIQSIRDNAELAFHKLSSQQENDQRLGSVVGEGNITLFSKREKEVLPYLVKAKTNVEIGIILGISPRTVEKHVASILEKLRLENRKALIRYK